MQTKLRRGVGAHAMPPPSAMVRPSTPMGEACCDRMAWLAMTVMHLLHTPMTWTATPDPAGYVYEGDEVIKLHTRIEGSLTIPTTGIKRVQPWEC